MHSIGASLDRTVVERASIERDSAVRNLLPKDGSTFHMFTDRSGPPAENRNLPSELMAKEEITPGCATMPIT